MLLFYWKVSYLVLKRKSRSPVYRWRLLLKYITWVQVRLLRLVSFWNAFGAMEARDTELRGEPLLGFIRKKNPYPYLYSERASKQNLPVKCSCSDEECQKRAYIHEINNQGERNVDVVLNLNHSSNLTSFSSVVDPDLDGSETFSRIRIREKSFRIWKAPDPKWIEVKILCKPNKMWRFLNKIS
jgi:hypothetical protein